MDDALVLLRPKWQVEMQRVLILVLMDDALVLHFSQSDTSLTYTSLNPCFNG